MEQISSSKIVSLHLHRCSGHCPNASVCYHIKKREAIDSLFINNANIRRLLPNYFTVHESVCHFEHHHHKRLLEECINYNITVSCKDIRSNDRDLYACRNKIQVSVYSREDILEYAMFQKLFLIKDWDSLKLAYDLMKIETGKLHFILEQEFLSSPEINPSRKIINFIMAFEARVDKLQSADTCLTSWVINGKCPYNSQNYIDLNYDSTIRKCPYTKDPLGKIPVFDIDIILILNNTFTIPFEPNCVYARIFKGDMYGRVIKDSNLQNSSTNSGDGSGPKRMRRLSLRN